MFRLFQDMLPPKALGRVRAFLGLVILMFFAVLAYYGIKMAQFGWSQETWATQIPRGIPYLGLPIGALVFGMHLILMFREWVDRNWEESSAKDEMDTMKEETPWA